MMVKAHSVCSESTEPSCNYRVEVGEEMTDGRIAENTPEIQITQFKMPY